MAGIPKSFEVLWPDPKTGPWLAVVWWRIEHGVGVPVGLKLTSWIDADWDPGVADIYSGTLPEGDAEVDFPTIGSQMLKELGVGALLKRSRQEFVKFIDSEDSLDWPSADGFPSPEDRAAYQAGPRHAELAGAVDALNAGKSAGRRLGIEHDREVARVYAEAVRLGNPPTQAVKDHFHLSKSAAAKRIARARERGLLPPTSRGRAGRITEER